MMTLQPRPEIFAGLVGELVDTFDAHTEADRVAVATQFLVGFGSALGRGPVVTVGETAHHMNDYLCIVGTSSRARKGDSGNVALRALREADPDWSANVASGLSSGEGLIYHARDATTGMNRKGELVVTDAGVTDKRLLVVESEFSTALKQFSRDGNVLSNVLRDAWDGKHTLRTLTKQSPIRATDVHVSVIAHTTPEDLARYLADVEAANGLGNRFLFVLANRSKLLPNPGRAPRDTVARLSDRVREALERGRGVGEIERTPHAAELWDRIYPALTAEKPGLLGKLLARSEAHVTRLAALYALVAGVARVDVEHLESALALWDYVEASTQEIFRARSGDRVADRILSAMLPGEAMTLEELRREVFSGHVGSADLLTAMTTLRDLGMVVIERDDTTGGRPRIVVTRGDPAQVTDEREATHAAA
jgi:hypothetical protein